MTSEVKRVLLVEDNLLDIEMTLNTLQGYNLANEVFVVRDGEEALDYLFRRKQYRLRHDGNPAVILLDNKMPKVSGIEVLRTIRGDELLKMIPVIMLTSSREEGDILQSYELGVNAYVVKPVNFSEFVDAIKSLGVFWALINEPPPGTTARPGT